MKSLARERFQQNPEQFLAETIKASGDFSSIKGPPGFKFGKVENAMGLRGIPETEPIFGDCIVAQENLLLVEDGFRKLMSAYNGQRVGASAVALGIAWGAFELAVEYSKVRKQFGRPICEFQGLMWMLADMRIQLDAARLLIYRAATTLENSFPRWREWFEMPGCLK